MLRILLYWLAYPLLVTSSVQDDLLVTMKNELNRIALPMPTTAPALMTGIQTDHSYAIGSASSEDLDRFISSWKLPEDVSALFQQSAYAFSEEFQSFTFRAEPSYLFFEEYLGAAKHVDNITLAYMHVKVNGTPIIQKNKVSTRTCHTCWIFAKCCSSATIYVPRGFTAPEIQTMMLTLRASAYQRLLKDFPSSTFLMYREILGILD